MSNGQLLGILKEIRDVYREDAQRPRIDCPYCGSLLDVNARTGELNCPMGDGYRVPGGTTKGREP